MIYRMPLPGRECPTDKPELGQAPLSLSRAQRLRRVQSYKSLGS